MTAREALERLERADLPPCPAPPPMQETRHRLIEAEAPRRARVHALDSAALVTPEDAGHIVAHRLARRRCSAAGRETA